jgi:RND family efflux transporter MFP subunit
MKRVGWVIVVAGAVAAASCKNEESKPELTSPSALPAPAIPAVSSLRTEEPAASATANTALSGTGTLYPREEAQLGPKMSGVLTAVNVEEGDKVKKGQLLFKLDSSSADLSVRQAKTQLETAEVQLRAAELDYKRTKELHDRGSIAPATFDQVQARYDSAKTSVSQAKVAVSMAQKMSGDSSVRSPITGVVSAKLKSVGETVTMMPPTIVVIVQDTSVLELRARLPERSLKTLMPGSIIHVKLPAMSITRDVPIKRINPALDVMTRTVEIIADLDNADGKLKPGMLAEIALNEKGEPEAPSDPKTAEKKRDQ